jgi:hypothetical protein
MYLESTKLRNHKNSHIGHCTHTAGSANVKVQNIFHGRNYIRCSTNCKYRTAATLYFLETLCQVINVNNHHTGDKRDDDDKLIIVRLGTTLYRIYQKLRESRSSKVSSSTAKCTDQQNHTEISALLFLVQPLLGWTSQWKCQQ